MFALLLALPSSAAEIQVATHRPINILVDGQVVLLDDLGLGTVVDLPAGKHVVESRNLMGKVTAYKEFEVQQNQLVKYDYRDRELWHIGTYDLQPVAPVHVPVAPTTQTQVTTTVVESHPTGGVGLTISDGYGTVSVGAGMGGTMVTETTTTTTTVGPAQGLRPLAVPPPSTGMAPSSYQGLLGQLDAASFSDDKLNIVRTAAAHNVLTCQQLAGIVDRFDFGNDKVQAVGLLASRVVDPGNAFLLSDHFDFSSDADKALAYFQR